MMVLYFASVREGIGLGGETVALPEAVVTADDFLRWMRGRGPAYDAALREELRIRVAVDKAHAAPDTPLRDAREIALFPMMTGG
ncbi:MAG: MoaD/ThiS family protein [Bauldia sp.]|nr:MoaD/ThiS family protein [Bauldia sp.]